MVKLLKLTPAVLLAFMVASAPAAEKDPSSPAEPSYHKTTVTHIYATVTDVREISKDKALSGVHLTVQSGSETLDVYVGPIEFLKACDFVFAKGDKLQVVGSKVIFENSTVILAREVTRAKVSLLIRDKEGEPLWKFFIRPPVG